MAWNMNIYMEDGMGKTARRSFQLSSALTTATDAGAAAGPIVDLYAALTDMKVSGGTVTQTLSGAISGHTPTPGTPAARRWRVGRITVALDPTPDGVQSLTTFEVPAIKAALEGAGGGIVDDGSIAAFLAKFTGATATEPGRMADGQTVSAATMVSGYVFSKAHPAAEA